MLLPFISFLQHQSQHWKTVVRIPPTRHSRNIILIMLFFGNAAAEDPLAFYFVKVGTISVWFDSDDWLTLVRQTALWFTRHDTFEVKLTVLNTSMNRMNGRTAMALFFKHPRVAALQLLASGRLKTFSRADIFLLFLCIWFFKKAWHIKVILMNWMRYEDSPLH